VIVVALPYIAIPGQYLAIPGQNRLAALDILGDVHLSPFVLFVPATDTVAVAS
jgi:hypothetical protein